MKHRFYSTILRRGQRHGLLQRSLLCMAGGLLGMATTQAQAPVADLADPFWGSTIGNVVPGVSVPFGMVKLSPNVPSPQAWQSTSGYEQGKLYAGFSHTHTSGTGGAPRYGNLLVTPLPGGPQRTHCLPARQKNEYAAAGYYRLEQQRPQGDVSIELTASRKVGMHRYHFWDYKGSPLLQATVQLDVSHTLSRLNGNARSTVCTGATAEVVGNQAMQGSASFRGGWGTPAPYTLHFYAEFSQPFSSAGSWTQDTVLSTSRSASGTAIGLYAGFGLRQKEPLLLKIAISYISIAQAKANLQQEAPGWDFDALRSSNYAQWQQHLSAVAVEGGSPEQRRMLYSALRNTLLMPTDVSGENPHWNNDKPHYWDHYCIWDVFRTAMPLHTLLYPQRQAAIVNSMLDVYKHRGWLPDAWIAGHYGDNQGGTNADVVLADALVKKLPGIDAQLAYAAMLKNATVPSDTPQWQGRFLPEYLRLGYLTTQSTKGAVSRTMEYAYNDFCIAQVAQLLGKKEAATQYFKQSRGVFHLFHDSVGYFWARNAAGQWEPEFTLQSKLTDYWNDPYFYEGGSEIYSYYVPHDMAGLVQRHGGAQAFARRLDAFFDEGRFDLGNEPLFLVPYSYHYAGMPHKTAERVRQLLSRDFTTGHQGLPGQDDSGAMSAWYVWSSAGIFPVAGQPLYLIGSPVFSKFTFRLGGAKSFTVEAQQQQPGAIYVQSASLNGKPLQRAWITHDELMQGGTLRLTMSSTPGHWGRSKLPFSLSTHQK